MRGQVACASPRGSGCDPAAIWLLGVRRGRSPVIVSVSCVRRFAKQVPRSIDLGRHNWAVDCARVRAMGMRSLADGDCVCLMGQRQERQPVQGSRDEMDASLITVQHICSESFCNHQALIYGSARATLGSDQPHNLPLSTSVTACSKSVHSQAWWQPQEVSCHRCAHQLIVRHC